MFFSSTRLLLATAAAVLLATPNVDAHGVVHKPEMKFKGKEYAGGYSARIELDAMPAVPPDKYAQNSWADIFGRAFKAQTKYKTLRAFLMDKQDVSQRVQNSNPMTPECGFTDPENQKPVALPDKIEWYGGGMNHPGPCEAWCDNEVVMPFTVNCQATYPDGKFPYDKSKCTGKKRFSFYWLAMQIPWQVYIDCSTIGEGAPPPFDAAAGGGGASNSTAPVSPSSAPAPAPSKAPASSPAPKKESVGGEAKCGVKRSRN
jgi:hypothetical protein